MWLKNSEYAPTSFAAFCAAPTAAASRDAAAARDAATASSPGDAPPKQPWHRSQSQPAPQR
jgi:hypothetical protein